MTRDQPRLASVSLMLPILVLVEVRSIKLSLGIYRIVSPLLFLLRTRTTERKLKERMWGCLWCLLMNPKLVISLEHLCPLWHPAP
ncbi:unnamed protein product [Linum trigynum]|uniref:Secreted protein n=1 Tax=Linum trigynum TaxID=586398 RepID=A0AAV2E5A3_9ROSI